MSPRSRRRLDIGKQTTIRLPEETRSGYHWMPLRMGYGLLFRGHRYERAGSTRDGRGRRVFFLEAVGEGKWSFEVILARPANPEDQIERRRFTITATQPTA